MNKANVITCFGRWVTERQKGAVTFLHNVWSTSQKDATEKEHKYVGECMARSRRRVPEREHVSAGWTV